MEKIILFSIMAVIIVIVLLVSNCKSNEPFEVKRYIRLLPFWAKNIGIIILILSILFNWSLIFYKQYNLNYVCEFSFAIGLLIIAFSAERHEDEMVMALRLNSAFIAFMGGIIAHLIYVLLNMILGGVDFEFNSLFVTNYILLIYILQFKFTKRKMRL